MRISDAGSVPAAMDRAFAYHAERVAIEDDDEHTTYAQLSEQASSVASALRPLVQRACAAGTPIVVVALPASAHYVLAIAGILKAGAAYLPVDPELPDAYLAQIVAGAQPCALVTTGALGERFRLLLGDLPVICLDDMLAAPSASTFDSVSAQPSTRAAYVVYTSGSTGEPKGVIVGHAAILNSTEARIEVYGPARRVPLIMSVAFDLTVGTLLWTLLSGGTTVIAKFARTDISQTLKFLRDKAINHLPYLPVLHSALLDLCEPGDLPDLVTMTLGGERWNIELARRHASILSSTSLYNEYGPSEASVWCSVARIFDASTATLSPLTIGRPIRNTTFHVLDSAAEPVERGTIGELYIAGANLAIGYLNNLGVTRQSFLTLPSGERAYRSGDLVRQDAQGDFVFEGRADRQLKLNGNRIEAEQVEKALMGMAGVKVSYVMVRNDRGGGQCLVAYVVLREHLAATGWKRELRSRLSATLPSYMVPSVFIALDAMPLTTTGKIDESEMPESDLQIGTGQSRNLSAVESAVQEAVGITLGHHGVDPDVALVDLGANSLALARLALALSKRFGVDVPIAGLFSDSTIQAIARLIESRGSSDRPPLAASDPSIRVAPLSAQQKQIWYLSQLSPDARAYNAQFTMRFTGHVDRTALEAAVTELVRRHEILRSTFHERDGELQQVVHGNWRPAIHEESLLNLAPAERDQALSRALLTTMREPFDIGCLPLFRWNLYRLDDDIWVLLQVEHHMVHDGWSGALMLEEVRDLYAAITSGDRVQLPEPRFQYRDYAHWYSQWQWTRDYEAHVQYWSDQLQACNEGVTFPTDFARLEGQTFSGECLRARVDAVTLKRIDERCAAAQCTRFAYFLSAFLLLAVRYSGEEDLVVGSAFANRRVPGTENVLGMFVNALPLRVAVNHEVTVGELVRRTMRTILEAQDHQELPLVDLVRHLKLTRDHRRNPLFQLMFAFHDSPMPRFELPSLRGEFRIEHNGSAKNDINVVCMPEPAGPEGGGLLVIWEYNSALYSQDSAERLLANFLQIVQTAMLNWDQRLDCIQILSAPELGAVLDMGRGEVAAPSFPLLHQGFEAKRSQNPQSIAVLQGDRSLSYGELDQLAQRIEATLLRQFGQMAGSVVAIACESSPELIACWLACSRQGALYVCIDASQPGPRVEELLRDAQARVVIVDRHGADVFAQFGVSLIDIEQIESLPQDRVPGLPGLAPGAGAYLTYTSGSTGKPKAVITSHANAITALTARTRYFGTEPPTTLVTLPPFFDVAGSMVFWTLWLGGCVVLPPHRGERDPEVLGDLIERANVTHVNFVASFYSQFLQALPANKLDRLRVVAIGGEACSVDLVERHADCVPGASLHNEYGPTEATVWCTAQCVYEPDRPRTNDVTIGRPLANYSVFTVNGGLMPQPIGVLGDLCVGGPGVARGYLMSQVLTAQKFVDCAQGPLAGQRLYLTGDRGRLRSDGQFELVGRADDQVKVRGYRVELGEVSQCLSQCPNVKDVLVVVRALTGDPAEVSQVVAYVIPSAPSADLERLVRLWAAQRLPHYMVPAFIVALPAFPLTPAGKIDRQSLPHPVQATSGPRARVAPQTSEQEKLLAVWNEILGQTDLGIDDDFYAAGGDSLQAIRVVSRARSMGLPISVASLMEVKTVRGLCDRIKPVGAAAPSDRRPAGTALPLSPIQRWFFAQEFVVPDHFNQARLFDVSAAIGTPMLSSAIAAVITRHDAFRTVFQLSEAGWCASLSDAGERPALEIVQVDTADEAGWMDLLQRHIESVQSSLSIEGNRLVRFVLIEGSSPANRLLLVVAHHLLVDSVSWSVLHDDLNAALVHPPEGLLPAAAGMATDEPPDLSSDEHAHWEQLARAAKPPSPTEGLVESSTFGEAIVIRRRLSSFATRHLAHMVGRAHPATIQAMLLAALASALSRDTSRYALYAMIEGHGRQHLPDADEIIGWLTSLFPVLLEAPSALDLYEAAVVFAQGLSAVPRGGVSFGQARYSPKSSALCAVLSAMPAPSVTFNFLGLSTNPVRGDVPLVPSPIQVGHAIDPRNRMPTPLDVTVSTELGCLSLRLSCSSRVCSVQRSAEIADRFIDALEEAAQLVCLSHSAAGPSAPRLTFIHPVGGALDWYLPIAGRLQSSFRSYGIAQSPADDALSIEEMAALYAGRLMARQSDRRYRLIGWSFGACVAYEMARILEEQGLEVDLVLVDPPSIGPGAGRGDGSQWLTSQLAGLFSAWPAASVATAVLATVQLSPDDRAHRLVADFERDCAGIDPSERSLLLDRLVCLLRNQSALAQWQPKGRVKSLRTAVCTRSIESGWNDEARWAQHAQVQHPVVVIPADHVTMLQSDQLVELVSAAAATRTESRPH